MRALLVVNPKATTFSARVRDVLAHALASQTRLDLVETKARGHAIELAASAAGEGYGLVVALGGDGTVNEVVNGLLHQGPGPQVPALAVVPGGNANVFARALGLPADPVEATGQLLGALDDDRRRTLSLGRAGDRWFTFCAGMGLDAAVVRAVERKRARGARATPALFVRTGLQEFFRSRERSEVAMRLRVAGGEPTPLGLALVCNTDPWTYLGDRPVRPCPEASFATGLDLMGLTSLPTVPVLRHLRQILSTAPRPRGRRVVRVHDATELELTASRPQPLQVDGDDLGDVERVVLRSVPRALQVVV